MELVGEYQESGFKDAPYIARRGDGQMVQLPEALFALAQELDGRRGYDELAQRFSERIERRVDPDDVRMLVEERLRPLGLLANADGSDPRVEKLDPLLALKFRVALVPKGVTRALTTLFLPLFHPVAVVAVLAALVAADVWFFFVHGVAQPLREVAYDPFLLLLVLALVVLATALHELGHATAARYGGAEPGAMGAGVYIVWPAFYTDVTDAYRLDRRGRLRTDLGGVYFNCLFVLGVVAAYAVTGFEPVLVLVLVQHMQILQQFLPFLRLDGYYILSDLTGVPDMFNRIKPTLKSAVPGAARAPEVEELKPWVRRVTTAWVLLLVPVLLVVFGLMVVNAPRVIATAWDSLLIQRDRMGEGGWATVTAVARSAMLVLPLAGAAYTVVRVAGRVGTGAWGWSAGSAPRRVLVTATSAALAAGAVWVLLPNGEYRPIQPTETGTLQGGVAQLAAVHTGRPALTERREQELDGAPSARGDGSGTAPADAETDDAPAEEEAPASTSGDPNQPAATTNGGATTAPADTTATVPTETTDTEVPAATTEPAPATTETVTTATTTETTTTTTTTTETTP